MLCARRTSISSRVMTATEPGVDMIGESVLVAPEPRVATNPLVPALTRAAVPTSAEGAGGCAEGLACRAERWLVSRRADALRLGWTGRCAGASTVTGGKLDAPGCPAFCAAAGRPLASTLPSASALAVHRSMLSCERK
jgi:hypothetical protein